MAPWAECALSSEVKWHLLPSCCPWVSDNDYNIQQCNATITRVLLPNSSPFKLGSHMIISKTHFSCFQAFIYKMWVAFLAHTVLIRTTVPCAFCDSYLILLLPRYEREKMNNFYFPQQQSGSEVATSGKTAQGLHWRAWKFFLHC